MEKIKISKEKIVLLRDIVIFALLFMWMVMPIFQTFIKIYELVDLEGIYFELMKKIAIVGIGFSIFDIFFRLKNAEDKKKVIKELIPIFIFVLYMAWTLISCFQAWTKRFAFQGTNYRKEGYYMYINYAGFFFCAFLLENKKLRKTLLNSFLLACMYLIIISIITLDYEPYSHILINTELDDTVFEQFNHYGYYLMMAFMCAFGLFMREENKIMQIVYLLSYALIGWGVIYNNTFGCHLAIYMMFILYGIYVLVKKNDRKKFLIAMIVFAILSAVTVKYGSWLVYDNMKELFNDIKSIFIKVADIEVENTSEEVIEKNFEEAGTYRMGLWMNAIDFIAKKPIIGYGPDNLSTQYKKVGIFTQDRPHNLLLYLACVSGIPGMILYVTAVGIIVVKGIVHLMKKNKNGMIYLVVVITYLGSSMFGNSMYYTSPYFFIFLGSLMNYNLKEKEE